MFLKIPIEEFRVEHPNTAVLGGDVLGLIDSLDKRGSKFRKEEEYSLRVLEHLLDGDFYGIITDLEYGKARNKVGERKFYRLVNSKIKNNKKARFFEARVAPYLDEYEKMPAYSYLFKLTRDGNMHKPNLTSIIAAIELDIIIVSNDPHFYWQRRNIRDAYWKRHKEEKKQAKDLRIYDPQYFVKDILPNWNQY